MLSLDVNFRSDQFTVPTARIGRVHPRIVLNCSSPLHILKEIADPINGA